MGGSPVAEELRVKVGLVGGTAGAVREVAAGGMAMAAKEVALGREAEAGMEEALEVSREAAAEAVGMVAVVDLGEAVTVGGAVGADALAMAEEEGRYTCNRNRDLTSTPQRSR